MCTPFKIMIPWFQAVIGKLLPPGQLQPMEMFNPSRHIIHSQYENSSFQ